MEGAALDSHPILMPAVAETQHALEKMILQDGGLHLSTRSSSIYQCNGSGAHGNDELEWLREENKRLMAAQQDMAKRLSQTFAQNTRLEATLQSGQAKLQQQRTELEEAKARAALLERERATLAGHVANVPEHAREHVQQLEEENKRYQATLKAQEAQVQRLKELILKEAQEVSELQEFHEAESRTLSERCAALEAQLSKQMALTEQLTWRCNDEEARALELEEQMSSLAAEVLGVKEVNIEMEAALRQHAGDVSSLRCQCAELSCQRDRAVDNLRKAELELLDVADANVRMVRQVRAISLAMERCSAQLSQFPELEALARSLHGWLAVYAQLWDGSEEGAGNGAVAAARLRAVNGELGSHPTFCKLRQQLTSPEPVM